MSWHLALRFGLSMTMIIMAAPSLALVANDTADLPGVDRSQDAANDSTDQLTTESFPLAEMPDLAPPPPRSEVPSFADEEAWVATRARILDDFASRISPEFHISEALRQRTEFWFNIYTRYGEGHHLIHHALYPWIVFKVVDTSELLASGKGPLWLRRQRGQDLAQRQQVEVRAALTHLAKLKNYSHLSALERDLFNKLIPIKGSRPHVFRQAALNVRSQLGQKDFFARGLVNSSRYLPRMEEIFRNLGLPTELTRMPFVESSFNEDARSKVGASGIWQIMPRTGKAYMIVNDKIDERNAPLKATLVAGRLLHSYNHALKSWPLTITSYNHGIGNIQKAIRRARSVDLAEIIARYHDGDFKFASSNFYTCFLAALFAEKYNELVFKEAPREPLQQDEVLRLSATTKVKSVERITGLSAGELLRYNLDLKSILHANGTLPPGYQLHLPPGLKDRWLRRVGVGESKNHGHHRT